MRGQVETMEILVHAAWALGMIFAILLVYLLMAVNFQSWLDPVHHPDGAAGRFRGHSLDAVL